MTEAEWLTQATAAHNRDTFRHQPADTRRQKIPRRFPQWQMDAAHKAAERQETL